MNFKVTVWRDTGKTNDNGNKYYEVEKEIECQSKQEMEIVFEQTHNEYKDDYNAYVTYSYSRNYR